MAKARSRCFIPELLFVAASLPDERGGGVTGWRAVGSVVYPRRKKEAMSNPVLVEVLRGDRVESRHAGAVAVLDADGGVVFPAGDIDAAVFPRSAVKACRRCRWSRAGRRTGSG